MTLFIVPKPGKTAGKKLARGLCSTPRCMRPARAGRADCETCKARKWRTRHPERALWLNLRKSAKKRGIPFCLGFEEFKAFCDRENFVARVGSGPEDATIDRREASGPYHIDNIRVLTNRENGTLGGALAGTGHRAPAFYTPEENPLSA
jgi:hypothetical protein